MVKAIIRQNTTLLPRYLHGWLKCTNIYVHMEAFTLWLTRKELLVQTTHYDSTKLSFHQYCVNSWRRFRRIPFTKMGRTWSHNGLCPWNSTRFILESKWTFVPNLRTFRQGVKEILLSQEWDVWTDGLKNCCRHRGQFLCWICFWYHSV